MKKKDHPSKAMAELHSQAEEQLKKKLGKAGAAPPETDIHRVYHELQVHQIELEMQNDELRSARAKLEESRSRYELLYDFSPIGYLTFDRKGRIEAINLTGAALIGLERQRLMKVPFSRFIQPDSLNAFLAHIEQVFTTDARHTCELWLDIKDHRPLHVAMESIAVERDDGDPVQCHSAIMDITARKQAEETLHKSEERLNLALTASNMGVWEWDVRTGGVFWSPECLKIMGVDHFSGKLAAFTDALHPEDAAAVRRAIDQSLTEKTIFTAEFRIIRPGGEVRWLSNLGRANHDRDGKPLRMTGTVQDITERKEAQEILNRYELLAGHSRDIVLFLRRDDGRILEANAAALKAYGYGREELLAMTIYDLRASKTKELIPAQMAKADGHGLLFESVHRRKDGRTFPVEVSSQGATIGDVRTLISVVRDITKRKAAERALRESEELFRTTFDESPIGTATVGLDRKIIRVNKEFSRMLGYRSEEIVGMTLRDITHPDDVEGVLNNFRMLSAGGIDSYKMEKRYLRKDGSIIWGRLSAALIRDAEGRPAYGLGMIEDITARKQAERYQHLAAEILRILNNPSPLADSINHILTAIQRETGSDAAGIRLRNGDDFPYYITNGFSEDFIQFERYLCERNEEGKIMRDEQGNAVLECMCGNILCGRTDTTQPFFTERGSFWSNSTTELLNSTTERDRQARTRNRCNAEGYESVALIPISSDDKVIGLLQLNDRRRNQFTPEMIRFLEGIGASIGVAMMRKQTERTVEERTEQLESANKELESFSYSVSHDLRAPLRAIDGYSRMILKREGDRFDDEARRQFNLIRDNTRTMGQLIDDILAFSRLGRQAIVASRIDMEALAKEIWSELRTINPERAMVLNIDKLPFGMGDRALIKQVLSNLLSNAVKFTRDRDAAVIEIGGREQENEHVYYVRDNGAGFDMKYYDRLFGVFQRLHHASDFEGTGVGLAIVQRIIHRHGGRVWGEGEPDRGATFYFTLPAPVE